VTFAFNIGNLNIEIWNCCPTSVTYICYYNTIIQGHRLYIYMITLPHIITSKEKQD